MPEQEPEPDKERVQREVQKHFQRLEGDMLTMAEISLPQDQAERAKDFIRRKFHHRMNLVWKSFHTITD